MRTSAIIVAYRQHRWLVPAIESVREQVDEVIVVDNGSGGAIAAVARRSGAKAHVLAENVGFPGAVNAGVRAAQGDVLALLNDDAMAEPGWIDSATAELSNAEVGAVTPKLQFALPYAELRFCDEGRTVGGDPRSLGRPLRSVTLDGAELLPLLLGPGVHRLERGTLDGADGTWRWTTGEEPIFAPLPDAEAALRLLVDGERAPVVAIRTLINSAGTYLSAHGHGGDFGLGSPDDGSFDEAADRFGGCGAAIVTTRTVLDRVGSMATNFFAYYEDLDWCWRVRLAGLRVRYQPQGVVRHVGGATSGGPADERVHRLASRNRLLCLTRNAPPPVLLRELRSAMADEAQRDLRGSVLAQLPRTLAQRRRLSRRWRRSPSEVWAEWAGVNERWPASAPS